jgi:GTP pyrophosphokinase
LVSAADKLHNARAILADYREFGEELWKIFNASKAEQLWYYGALVDVLEGTTAPKRLVTELRRVVDQLNQLAV